MALTKTTSIDEVDAWQAVVGGALGEGTAKSISDSFATLLYVELAPIEAVATDGAEVIVEVSYGDDNWTQLTVVKGTAETPATTTINDADVQAGESTLTLTDAQIPDITPEKVEEYQAARRHVEWIDDELERRADVGLRLEVETDEPTADPEPAEPDAEGMFHPGATLTREQRRQQKAAIRKRMGLDAEGK